jgi:hypothetical protein
VANVLHFNNAGVAAASGPRRGSESSGARGRHWRLRGCGQAEGSPSQMATLGLCEDGSIQDVDRDAVEGSE